MYKKNKLFQFKTKIMIKIKDLILRKHVPTTVKLHFGVMNKYPRCITLKEIPQIIQFLAMI